MSAELSPHEANSRFQYLEPPFPLPGKCAVCGNVKRPVVDFGANIDPYGAVLLCIACVAEAYALLIRNDVVRVPQTTPPEELLAVNEQLKDEFNDRVGSLARVLDAYNGLLSRSASQVTEQLPESTDGTTGESVPTDVGTTEPASNVAGDKGSTSVSSSRTSKSATTGI